MNHVAKIILYILRKLKKDRKSYFFNHITFKNTFINNRFLFKVLKINELVIICHSVNITPINEY